MRRYARLAIGLAALTIAAAAYGLTVTSRSQEIGGVTVGDVVVDNGVPIRIRFSAGGLSAPERAAVVARRLSGYSDLKPSDITVGRVGTYWAVLARGDLLVTADPGHALANRTSSYDLALMWQNQLRSALVGEPVTPPTGAGPSTPAVSTSQKVVPILSVGSGIRVGAAVVAGSADQVAKVKAVAQIEAEFGGRAARIRALVPVESENVVSKIRRVPGTAVIGVADIKL